MSKASYEYTHERALEDCILLNTKGPNGRIDWKNLHNHDANCTYCHRIGKYMEICGDDGNTIQYFTTAKCGDKLRINPYIVAHCFRVKPDNLFITNSRKQENVIQYTYTQWKIDWPYSKPYDERWTLKLAMWNLMDHKFDQMTEEQVELLRQLVSRSVLE